MICREPKCREHAACDACGCCEDHCPGHFGLMRGLRLKTGQATRTAAETAPLTINTFQAVAADNL